MEVWFAEKIYTAMAVQAVVGATALCGGLGGQCNHLLQCCLGCQQCCFFLVPHTNVVVIHRTYSTMTLVALVFGMTVTFEMAFCRAHKTPGGTGLLTKATHWAFGWSVRQQFSRSMWVGGVLMWLRLKWIPLQCGSLSCDELIFYHFQQVI